MQSTTKEIVTHSYNPSSVDIMSLQSIVGRVSYSTHELNTNYYILTVTIGFELSFFLSKTLGEE